MQIDRRVAPVDSAFVHFSQAKGRYLRVPRPLAEIKT